MSIDVDPDWWQTLFDEVYLLTDARSVCDEDITRLEVNVICELLPVAPGHRILDLCGGHGRHCFELCQRGFAHCTLLDYSEYLTGKAQAAARDDRLPIEVIRADARSTGLPSQSFDHVLIMGNSLGYVQQPEADTQIIAEALRLLRPGGWLLVDVTDGAAVRAAFNPMAWHEIGDDIVVCRRRELEQKRVVAREMVLSKDSGLIRDRTYAIRLYEPRDMEHLLARAGFSQIRVHTRFSPQRSGDDYGFMNHRMLATGCRR